jgi:hypothetical protein
VGAASDGGRCGHELEHAAGVGRRDEVRSRRR